MSEEQDIEAAQLEARLRRLVGQWSQGRVSLREIVGLSEDELHSLATHGYCLFLQGKSEAAKVVFEGLVAIDPRNAYYYRALGVIYWRLKEPEKAIRQFSYAMRVAPREVENYINRAEVYVATKRFDLARNDLNFALKNATLAEEALVKKAQAILRMI